MRQSRLLRLAVPPGIFERPEGHFLFDTRENRIGEPATYPGGRWGNNCHGNQTCQRVSGEPFSEYVKDAGFREKFPRQHANPGRGNRATGRLKEHIEMHLTFFRGSFFSAHS